MRTLFGGSSKNEGNDQTGMHSPDQLGHRQEEMSRHHAKNKVSSSHVSSFTLATYQSACLLHSPLSPSSLSPSSGVLLKVCLDRHDRHDMKGYDCDDSQVTAKAVFVDRLLRLDQDIQDVIPCITVAPSRPATRSTCTWCRLRTFCTARRAKRSHTFNYGLYIEL